ncbi:MAG: hypothetical protein D6731_12785 [Planctomycetota bacterium]|nr:MAG: hypothetical protein D6731_12785 [Planctomycetota bacterium]
MRPPFRLCELAGLLAAAGVAAVLLLANPGADVPWDAEGTQAPLLDAFWYMELGAARAEGFDPEPLPLYDPPVWTSLVRVWFSLWGGSLASAQALGALVGLTTLLLLWRVVRAGFGPEAALAAAGALAVLYPWVALARTTLVYGPLACLALLAAALWLGARRARGLPRAAREAAAWALILGAGAAVRPPVWAALGGLALASLARYPRLRPWAVASGSALGAGLLAFVASPERARFIAWLERQGGFWALTGYRLRVKLDPDLGLNSVLGGWCGWGVLPTAGGAPGYAVLAPWTCLAASLGALLLLARRSALRPAARECALLFAGWWGTFVCFLPLFAPPLRPLRHFALLAPPVAALAGYAVACWTRSPSPEDAAEGTSGKLRRADPLVAGAALVLGAALWTHVSCLALGAAPGRAPVLAGEGVLLGAVGWGVATALRPRRRAITGWALALAVFGAGLWRCGRAAAHPTYVGAAARAGAQRFLEADRARLLAGPYAPFVGLGTGLPRLRGAWIITRPGFLERTAARLERTGVTHIALDAAQAHSARLVERLASRGLRCVLLARLPLRPPRGEAIAAPLLLYRLEAVPRTPR